MSLLLDLYGQFVHGEGGDGSGYAAGPGTTTLLLPLPTIRHTARLALAVIVTVTPQATRVEEPLVAHLAAPRIAPPAVTPRRNASMVARLSTTPAFSAIPTRRGAAVAALARVTCSSHPTLVDLAEEDLLLLM